MLPNMNTATAPRQRKAKGKKGSPRNPYTIEPGPDPVKESVVYYYEELPKLYRRTWGVEPSRTTLTNWLAGGYPIRRGGPYVAMPCWTVLRRPLSTRQALSRWITLVRKLEAEQ